MKFVFLEMKQILSVFLKALSFEEADKIVWRLGITAITIIKGQEEKGMSVPMSSNDSVKML